MLALPQPHGHTFQVIGQNGPGARKDTVIVSPGIPLEVDFDADNPGMMAVVSYVK